MDLYNSLSHTKWDCKYHVVFIPKRRRKALFGKVRSSLGQVFKTLAQQKECEVVEGHTAVDHVHMLISIPPKCSVASIVGFIKGKSTIIIVQSALGKDRNFTGEHFWARGYFVSTVGINESIIRKYIEHQGREDSGQAKLAF